MEEPKNTTSLEEEEKKEGNQKSATEIILEQKNLELQKALENEKKEKARLMEGLPKEAEEKGKALADIMRTLEHFELSLKFHENDTLEQKQKKLAEELIKKFKLDYKISFIEEALANDLSNIINLCKKILLEKKDDIEEKAEFLEIEKKTRAMNLYEKLKREGKA